MQAVTTSLIEQLTPRAGDLTSVQFNATQKLVADFNRAGNNFDRAKLLELIRIDLFQDGPGSKVLAARKILSSLSSENQKAFIKIEKAFIVLDRKDYFLKDQVREHSENLSKFLTAPNVLERILDRLRNEDKHYADVLAGQIDQPTSGKIINLYQEAKSLSDVSKGIGLMYTYLKCLQNSPFPNVQAFALKEFMKILELYRADTENNLPPGQAIDLPIDRLLAKIVYSGKSKISLNGDELDILRDQLFDYRYAHLFMASECMILAKLVPEQFNKLKKELELVVNFNDDQLAQFLAEYNWPADFFNCNGPKRGGFSGIKQWYRRHQIHSSAEGLISLVKHKAAYLLICSGDQSPKAKEIITQERGKYYLRSYIHYLKEEIIKDLAWDSK